MHITQLASLHNEQAGVEVEGYCENPAGGAISHIEQFPAAPLTSGHV